MRRYRVILSEAAKAHLLNIQAFIGQAASRELARNYVDRIVDKCMSLDEYPARGTPRDDLRPGLRTVPFQRRVTITYIVESESVIVLGIFYGGQDFEALMREE